MGNCHFGSIHIAPPPKKKEINLSCVGWCAPSFQRLRQQNHLEVPVQPLLYRGFLSPKRKEIWSSVDASFSQIFFMQAWGLAFSHQHPQRKSSTVVCACDPSTGEQETRGCLGLASKLVWLSQILRVLFKIRQWEIEDSDAPPEALCTHAHSKWEISSFFHELEFLCLCVCMWRMHAKHSWGIPRTSCGVCSPLPSLCGN